MFVLIFIPGEKKPEGRRMRRKRSRLLMISGRRREEGRRSRKKKERRMRRKRSRLLMICGGEAPRGKEKTRDRYSNNIVIIVLLFILSFAAVMAYNKC